jgi:hypothetical protein
LEEAMDLSRDRIILELELYKILSNKKRLAIIASRGIIS